MTGDWKRTIHEAIATIDTRYGAIGSTTGVPFLAIVYPPAVERGFWNELRFQLEALRPRIDARYLDLLSLTTRTIDELGLDTVIGSLEDPFTAVDARADLGRLWLDHAREEVRKLTTQTDRPGRPVIVIESIAALYPAAGPFMLMQTLWNDEEARLEAPVLVPIPGTREGPRSYRFLDRDVELMYRGDLL
ncbi:MAG: hypothetical protein AB7S61_11875 [Methanoregulaceae archaeon]